MSNYKISRRFLLTSSGTALLLPLLESLIPFSKAFAQSVSDPRRYVGVYFPNGSYNRQGDAVWYPATGALNAANLPPIFQPFASQTGNFSIMKFIGNTAQEQNNDRYGGSHLSAVMAHFTGEAVSTNPQNTNACVIKGSSIDQIVAKASGKASINIAGGGVNAAPDKFSGFPYGYYLSFDSGKQIEPTMNPVNLYKRVLGQITTMPSPSPAPSPSPSPAPAPAPGPGPANLKKSILDLAIADIQSLQKKLGKNDVAKLDDYLTSVRAMELKVAAVSPQSVFRAASASMACVPPAAPSAALNNSDPDMSRSDYVARMQAMFDVIAFAFKCDITRSVSVNLDGDNEDRFLSGIPANLVYQGALPQKGTHSLSHSADSGGRNAIITRDRLYLSFVFQLVDALKAAMDPSGSPILDNTVIDAGHGVRDANHQDGQEAGVPMIVAGGRNFLSPGFAYDVGAYDRRDLLYTIANKLGTGITSFQGATKLMKI